MSRQGACARSTTSVFGAWRVNRFDATVKKQVRERANAGTRAGNKAENKLAAAWKSSMNAATPPTGLVYRAMLSVTKLPGHSFSMECPEAMDRGRNFRLLAEEELPELLDFLADHLPESLKFATSIKVRHELAQSSNKNGCGNFCEFQKTVLGRILCKIKIVDISVRMWYPAEISFLLNSFTIFVLFHITLRKYASIF
ncbi:uncharacterized protein LOC143215875 [Lasioglossum baleicum]|uniref:uncharacterized protein LOC143215875 n=1 Tax=Lasioglossum baleicum TaxID=434251 RepID=UPI003FCEBD28